MKMKALAMAALVAASVVMTGCTIVPGPIMDKSKPIDQGRYTVLNEVSATEKQVHVFGYGLGDLRGSAGRRLYKKALEQAEGADALIEYAMDTKVVNIGPVMITVYTLTGKAVKTDNVK